MASDGREPTRTPTSPVDGSGDVQTRNRSSTASSGRIRSASLRFLESSPPSGMWSATGTTLAQAPTPLEIRRGSFGQTGWNEEIQRRNSNISEESSRRLSRTPSAQTPGSLGRVQTSRMDAPAEAEDEGDGRFSPRSPKASHRPLDVDDEDDPFSKFIGRGRISDQSYIPKSKATSTTAARPKSTADPYAIPDDEDELDPLDDAPAQKRGLPKKFVDPAGNTVSKPTQKQENLTSATSGTARPPSPLPKTNDQARGPDADGFYPTGYKFPPKHTWWESTVIGSKALWKFFLTPLGFLVVIYGLNVVAWGGMLFLLLIGGGSEFMCYPPGSHGEKECNNIDSPRRIWIEIDSQILNALFCVTGFGLIPWRFRDFYYLLQYRIRHQQSALRRLAGIHRTWFRLPGSEELPTDPHASIVAAEENPALPLPPTKAPDGPLTGIRAPSTRMWKLDYVIWAFVLNTFLQAVLSGFMWGFNRYKRPSWSTGTFVALACIVAGLGGLMQFQEGKRIKKFEGIPVNAEEVLRDAEHGVADGEKKSGKSKREDTVSTEKDTTEVKSES